MGWLAATVGWWRGCFLTALVRVVRRPPPLLVWCWRRVRRRRCCPVVRLVACNRRCVCVVPSMVCSGFVGALTRGAVRMLRGFSAVLVRPIWSTTRHAPVFFFPLPFLRAGDVLGSCRRLRAVSVDAALQPVTDCVQCTLCLAPPLS